MAACSATRLANNDAAASFPANRLETAGKRRTGHVTLNNVKPRPVTRRGKILVPIAGAVSVLAIVAAVLAAVMPGGSGASPGRRSFAVPGNHDPSAIGPFAGQVDDLGRASYPTVYAGDQLSSGSLSVYIVKNGEDGSFRGAISDLNTGHLAYTIVYVERSLADMTRAGDWITAHVSSLMSQGIEPVSWGPRGAADAVVISLATPTAADLASLTTAAASAVPGKFARITAADYVAAAQAVVRADAPSNADVIVDPSLRSGQPSPAAN